MQCPTCMEQALEAVTTAQGTLQRCPSCTSFFIGFSMLEAYSTDKARCRAALSSGGPMRLATSNACPQCNERLMQDRLREPRVILTLCVKCQALWTDFRTLLLFDKALERALRAQIEAHPVVKKSMVSSDANVPFWETPKKPAGPSPFAQMLKSAAKSLEKMADKMGASSTPAPAASQKKKVPLAPVATPVPITPKPAPAAAPAPVPVAPPPVPPAPVIAPPPVAEPPAPKPEPVKPAEPPKPIPVPVTAKPMVPPKPKKPSLFSGLGSLFTSPPKKPAVKPEPKAAPAPKPVAQPTIVPKPQAVPIVKEPKPKKPSVISEILSIFKSPPKKAKLSPDVIPANAGIPKPLPAKVDPPLTTGGDDGKKPSPPTPAQPLITVSVTRAKITGTERVSAHLPRALGVLAVLVHALTAYEFEWLYALTWMLLGWSIGRFVRLAYVYRGGKPTSGDLASLAANTPATRWLAVPVTLKGTLLSRSPKPRAPWWLKDDSGEIPLDRHPAWDVSAIVFGVSDLSKMAHQPVELLGWYRGGKNPWIEITELRFEKLKRSSMVRAVQWTFTGVLCLATLIILLTSY